MLTKIYYYLVKIISFFLVKITIVRNNFLHKELSIDNKTIMYILPHYSQFDLFILRMQCIKYNLPDPFTYVKFKNIEIPRNICIHNTFKHKSEHSYYIPHIQLIKLFNEYTEVCEKDDLNIFFLPVCITLGQLSRYTNGKKVKLHITVLKQLHKIFLFFLYGCNVFLDYSNLISLKDLFLNHGKDKLIVKKLIKLSSIYFLRRKLAVLGPSLHKPKKLYTNLLQSKIILKSIIDESISKKITLKESYKNAFKILKEISANFSYLFIHIADYTMSFIFKKIYKKINVNGINYINTEINKGNKIIYIPCHRSHMDYLLISYVLYHQGFMPPHIAAGINLNFYPIGFIFRKLGAFFIRRTFKNNKLYSVIFREYLIEIMHHGYAIEYFIEGKRSRTGRLLNPKTGMLTMTLQAVMRNIDRPISIIPIYIGYEQIIEINDYIEELYNGKQIHILKKIYNYLKLIKMTEIYINFSKPISLMHYLNKNYPAWPKYYIINNNQSRLWLSKIVHNIAFDIMTRINEVSSINAVNLCALIILSVPKYSLTRTKFIKQLNCYLELLQNISYSSNIVNITVSAEKLLNYIIRLHEFHTQHDIITLPVNKINVMNYYYNNIQHMLIIPSLITTILLKNYKINIYKLYSQIKIIYPLIKNELFLKWNIYELPHILNNITKQLKRQNLIFYNKDYLQPNFSFGFYDQLQLISMSSIQILEPYFLIFSICITHTNINSNKLEEYYHILIKDILIAQDTSRLKYFDKEKFNSILVFLKENKFLYKNGQVNKIKLFRIWNILKQLNNNIHMEKLIAIYLTSKQKYLS
ncbi:MAG: glycerol-3-phosphate 1-O-acyltransferase PlsB [Pantoea sp. Brub]|nr:glycerol-3-phosphate 1-O-acyltransferase PlsB [Pantoea sp. Brub]